jgi:DNA replication protein DnaC
VRCPCLVEKAIKSALPEKYFRASLTDFKRAAQDQIVEWLVAPSAGLFITGPTGSGKTHLAAAIVRARFLTGQRASFRRASELYAQVRGSYGADAELSESAILAGYRGSPMLVLDDLAAGSLSDHERRIALEIIDSRGNDCLPTIVTSNWTLEAIAEKMDERIASRLREYRPFAFAGADKRKAK